MDEVLERGDVTFFVRPRVQPADAPPAPPPRDADGVQAFFLVLGAGERHRRLRIGRKRLPAGRGQRYWACVERVGPLDRVVGDQLEAETYTTKTRGERYQPPAHPVAQGEYELVRRDDHVRLSYRVEAREQGGLMRDFGVADEGTFVLLFKDRRGRAVWTTQADPLRELDREDAELVLVGAGSGSGSGAT